MSRKDDSDDGMALTGVGPLAVTVAPVVTESECHPSQSSLNPSPDITESVVTGRAAALVIIATISRAVRADRTRRRRCGADRANRCSIRCKCLMITNGTSFLLIGLICYRAVNRIFSSLFMI